MNKTIILIEDDKSAGILIKNLLKTKGFEVIWLKTFDEALDYLSDFKDSEATPVDAIIFDYMLDEYDSNVTSLPLVKMMKHRGYAKPMIANSSDPFFNELLQEAGCTHVRSGASKSDIIEFVAEHIFE